MYVTGISQNSIPYTKSVNLKLNFGEINPVVQYAALKYTYLLNIVLWEPVK